MRRGVSTQDIDGSVFFMPERLTPLYHTAIYAQLSPIQRRSYNQRHACYLNEQTIFFEREMARPILGSFLRGGKLPERMHAMVRQFMAEESMHSEMFRRLNRRARPETYARSDFHFVRPGVVVSGLLGSWVRSARRFPLFLWLLLLQEERAMYYAGEFLREAGLEPGFVAVQRQHLADEVGHVRWDEELLAFVWPRTSLRWRRVNARVLGWLIREYFTAPKRSGLRVAAEWVAEFPELRGRWAEIRRDLLGLGRVPEFNRLAYSREVTPRAFAAFDRGAEFACLVEAFPCYRRTPVAAVTATVAVAGQA